MANVKKIITSKEYKMLTKREYYLEPIQDKFFVIEESINRINNPDVPWYFTVRLDDGSEFSAAGNAIQFFRKIVPNETFREKIDREFIEREVSFYIEPVNKKFKVVSETLYTNNPKRYPHDIEIELEDGTGLVVPGVILNFFKKCNDKEIKKDIKIEKKITTDYKKIHKLVKEAKDILKELKK